MRQRLMRVWYGTNTAEIDEGTYMRAYSDPFPKEVLGRRIIGVTWLADEVEVTWLVEDE